MRNGKIYFYFPHEKKQYYLEKSDTLFTNLTQLLHFLEKFINNVHVIRKTCILNLRLFALLLTCILVSINLVNCCVNVREG